MAIFKRRSTAALIALIVVVLGTLFGVHRSVGGETAKIEAQFYSGVYLKDEKYTQPSIQSQLDKRNPAALGLVSVASNYPELKDMTDALRSAQHELADAGTIPEKYAANEKMQAAYVKLNAALAQRELKDNEKASAASYAGTLDGAQSVIGKSAYNSQVEALRNKLRGFPVNILKNLAFVQYPDYFGAEG
ncbi:hypothetical protein SAMN02745823_02151 [Sporobacter termitidis DSM 10068]|uniref:LemA family protein n=1 Tax=Sporobacter termitidis DSM 10068 TaxID=1123282 RepID=A0A1M5Y1M0_9FIRM|nr:LemA family protein [Sporobacter termitidis]SHI05971.1 hypothetical protein SAMN02745823_02151 [Sporobacter termitidis DSM 10068]